MPYELGVSAAPFAHTGPRAGVRLRDDRRAPTTTVSPTRCAAAAVACCSGCTTTYEFDTNDRVIPLADAIFTNDAASLDYYPVAARVHHLPLGGCPVTHFRAVERRTAPDLFFCGHLFANRLTFLDRLAQKVPDLDRRLLVIGSSDVDARVPGWYRATIPNIVLPDYYNTALSVLNIGRDLNLANRRYGIRASTPGPRTFEAAFAGAAQIFVGDGLEITDYFEPDREILLANSAEGFLEHFARLKREPGSEPRSRPRRATAGDGEPQLRAAGPDAGEARVWLTGPRIRGEGAIGSERLAGSRADQEV